MMTPRRLRGRTAGRRRPQLEGLEERALLAVAAPGVSATPLVIQLSGPAFVLPLPLSPSSDLTLSETGVPGLIEASGTADALAALEAELTGRAGVSYVETVRTVEVARSPNDPSFVNGQLWGLSGAHGVKAPAAWDATIGSTQVIVAGIDTGIDYNHPDLYLNIWLNQAEIPSTRRANLVDTDSDGRITFHDLNAAVNQGVGKVNDLNADGRITAADILAPMQKDAGGNDTGLGGWSDGVSQHGDTAHVDDLVGWNFVADNNNPLDDHGHGTHTAGTMVARGDNTLGVVGLNWVGQVMALKMIGANGSGTDPDAAEAIRYAADHGAIVSNNSWGDDYLSQPIADAIAHARSKGHIFVAAAGNSGSNIDPANITFYPAEDPSDNVISVAALNSGGNRAGFSNFGLTSVDLAAPGENVWSTTRGSGYGPMSGTSMAAPHVAGVVALVASVHPTWTYTQIISQVLASTNPLASLAGLVATGGALDAAAAVGNPTPPAGSATFVKTDSTTQGAWKNAYGADGFAIAQDPSATNPTFPAYATVSRTGALDYSWTNSTADPRALVKAASGDRLAACWYSTTSFSLDLNLTDGQTHQVALYLLDWDRQARTANIQISDGDTGALLDTRGVSGYDNGVYLVWQLKGHVVIRLTNTGPWSTVLSGLFFGVGNPTPPAGSATFVKTDSTTQGAWKNAYGADGFAIAQDPSATNPTFPAYATVSRTGALDYSWTNSTADPRALVKAASGDRLAACWYSTTSFSLDLNLTDGQTHQVALYLLDWDRQARTANIQISDGDTGALLDTRGVSGYDNGVYLVWQLKGHVVIRLTNTGPWSTVLSGLFFGVGNPTPPAGSATFVKTDSTTQGAWKNAYGADGFAIAQDPSATNPTFPAYATVSRTGALDYSWTNSTADPRALVKAASGDRLAACWYSTTSFSLDLNLTDGQTHQVALYLLDWDRQARTANIQISDGDTGALLDTRGVSGYDNGVYLVWQLKGHVVIRLTNTGPWSTVLSGLFFGVGNPTPPAGSATFVKTDSTTQGAWKNAYGADGFAIAQDPSATNPTFPAYATVSRTGALDYSWTNSTADPRALVKAASGDRLAACWYSTTSFSLDLNLTDGQTHQVALYLLDWDRQARTANVQIFDGDTGTLLDTRGVSGYDNGVYLVWQLKGHVVIRLTNTGPWSTVLSGLFFQ